MRRITKVFDENVADKSKSIYVNVEVDYGNGITGFACMTRAKVERIILQENIMSQYSVPENVIDDFVDKCFEEEQAEHFYDNECN